MDTRATALILIRIVTVLAALLSGPYATFADPDAKSGLLWNRSGLPAVFPLQVKSAEGQNLIMTLANPKTGEDVLSARIVGGEFFRVLVPPGLYDVRFSEETDDDPNAFHLDRPLEFQVKGYSVKAGHLIDISDLAGDDTARPFVKAQSICQRFALTGISPPSPSYRQMRDAQRDEGAPLRPLEEPPNRLRVPRKYDWQPDYTYELQSRFCD